MLLQNGMHGHSPSHKYLTYSYAMQRRAYVSTPRFEPLHHGLTSSCFENRVSLVTHDCHLLIIGLPSYSTEML